MRIITLIALFVSSINLALSQWSNFGIHGSSVQMTENQVGFKAINTPGPSPATGITYDVISTQDDWLNQATLKTGGGWNYGCCKATNMYFLNASTGVFTSEYQANNFTLYKTQDSGVNWSVSGSYASCKVKSTCVTSDSISYIALNRNSGNAQLFKTVYTNDIIILDIDSLVFPDTDIEFPNPKTGFLIMNDTNQFSYLFKTNDYGNNWDTTYFDSLEITSISFPDSLTGYMVSKSTNIIHKTADGGDNWTDIPTPTSAQINAIDFLNDTLGYFACNAGEIYKTTNGGTSWNLENSGLTSNLIDIQVVDINNAYCISENGDLLKNSSFPLNFDTKEVYIYPNPSDDYINIATQDSTKLYTVKIYNLLGDLVLTSNEKKIQVENLNSGCYHAVIHYDQQEYITKFIKN